MKSFPLIFWFNSEYFEYRQQSNRLTNKKVTGFKKKNFTTFLGKTKTYARPRYVCQYLFFFIFVYVMLMLKEFCISKGPHSKNLVNRPTLVPIIFPLWGHIFTFHFVDFVAD